MIKCVLFLGKQAPVKSLLPQNYSSIYLGLLFRFTIFVYVPFLRYSSLTSLNNMDTGYRGIHDMRASLYHSIYFKLDYYNLLQYEERLTATYLEC